MSLPSAAARAVASLEAHSGRTLVIAAAQEAVRAELSRGLKAQLAGDGVLVLQVTGRYRDRTVPYGAVAGILAALDDPDVDSSSPVDSDSAYLVPPVLSDSNLDEPSPRRRGHAGRSFSFLTGAPDRSHSAAEVVDPTTFWRRVSERAAADPSFRVALFVDDAAFLDTDSRDFVLYLSERARYRPLLVVVALDPGVAAMTAWEERLHGRTDVDWMRLSASDPDPRESARLKEAFRDLPDVTRRVVVGTALLGGSVNEVTLSRLTRLGFDALGSAIAPAIEAGLVRVADGKVAISRTDFVAVIPDLIPIGVRQAMHREIGEALAALSPEPNIERRVEIARHFFAAERSETSLRYLLEAAELTATLFAFDVAEELLSDAILCLPFLPPAEGGPGEAEVRLFHARVLAFSGRPAEAEREIEEGVGAALFAAVDGERLADMLLPVIAVVKAVGPRPSLAVTLGELADRCHDAGRREAVVVLHAMLVELELARGELARARSEAERGARVARALPSGAYQAMGLLAVGLSRIGGHESELPRARRLMDAAHRLLGTSGQYVLQQYAEDARCRWLEGHGQPAAALEIRERCLPLAQRIRASAIELAHLVGATAIRLDRNSRSPVGTAVDRIRQLSDQLHLLPPSPDLLKGWLLAGRRAVAEGLGETARDRFRAVAELPSALAPPELRVEALLRRAELELRDGDESAAQAAIESAAASKHVAGLSPWAQRTLGELRAALHAGTAPAPVADATVAAQPSDGNAPGTSA